MAYIIGNTVVTFCQFKALDLSELPDIVRALTNPSTVTVTVTNPNAVVTTPTAVNVSAGVYYVLTVADVAGVWRVRFVGTGAAAAVSEKTFTVTA